MGKELFLSDYTNKKGEKKYSLGMSKNFINSLYELDVEAFEQLFDLMSEQLEISTTPNEEKVERLNKFLQEYFSL